MESLQDNDNKHVRLEAPRTAVNLDQISNNGCKVSLKMSHSYFKLFNFTFVLLLR